MAVETVDEIELERRNTTAQIPELLGIDELMTLLGVSRQRLTALPKDARLPAPVVVLARHRAGPTRR